MKKLTSLLIAVILVTSVTGCGCGRRLRDWLCRGAYCGAAPAIAAPAPIAACPPPMYAAPPVAAYDPGCGYGGVQTYGYGSGYDSGWIPGGCNDCGGSYAMPSYDQGYVGDLGTTGTVDPSPAPLAQ